MKYIFSDLCIKGNEILFYSYIISIVLMILITILLVKKELGKRK